LRDVAMNHSLRGGVSWAERKTPGGAEPPHPEVTGYLHCPPHCACVRACSPHLHRHLLLTSGSRLQTPRGTPRRPLPPGKEGIAYAHPLHTVPVCLLPSSHLVAAAAAAAPRPLCSSVVGHGVARRTNPNPVANPRHPVFFFVAFCAGRRKLLLILLPLLLYTYMDT